VESHFAVLDLTGGANAVANEFGATQYDIVLVPGDVSQAEADHAGGQAGRCSSISASARNGISAGAARATSRKRTKTK
jgi:hypothetical protein